MKSFSLCIFLLINLVYPVAYAASGVGLYPLHFTNPASNLPIPSALARADYIVAALDHPGDNAKDSSQMGTAEVFLGRPRQLSVLISAVLVDKKIGGLVDKNRIGAIGFSLGSYTVLTAAGARPNFTLIKKYCREPNPLAFCENHANIRTIVPPNDMTDSRIKAVVALAPFGIFFDKKGLKELQRPVLLYAAENDQALISSYNADTVRHGLPANTPYFMIPEAGYFIFLAPCSSLQAKKRPDLCTDPKSVDRAKIHKEMLRNIIQFFENLGI